MAAKLITDRICDYCSTTATKLVIDTGECVCDWCAKDQFSVVSEWCKPLTVANVKRYDDGVLV